MKYHLISNHFVILGLCLGTTVALGQSALAQQSPQAVNPIDNRERDTYQSNEQDPMSGAFGGSFNAFDLIHRANMSRGRTMGEFQQESDSGIRNAAEDFKRQQNERLQNQPSEGINK
jgi:hypothetical protein